MFRVRVNDLWVKRTNKQKNEVIDMGFENVLIKKTKSIYRLLNKFI